MPILQQEPCQFPQTLFNGDEPVSNAACWRVLHTLPRREKSLLRKLQALQIWHYGPVISQRHRSPAGRVRTSFLPLFPGYVFVFCDRNQQLRCLETGCVAHCLEVSDGGQLFTELQQIWKMLQFDSNVTPQAAPLRGQMARVVRGPLAGLTGTVTAVDGRHRLTLMVSFMQQGATITVDLTDLEIVMQD